MGTSFRLTLICIALMAVGCKKSTTVLQVQAGGKPLPYVRVGETLRWTDTNDRPFTVTFKPLSPCRGGEKVVDTCVVEKAGYFPYNCVGCADPGVKVGSNGEPIQFTFSRSSSRAVASTEAGVYCDGTVKIEPDPTIGSKPQAVGDSNVEWLPIGDSIHDFTVTLHDGTCRDSNTINQQNSVCWLLPTAPAEQTYTITANGCSSGQAVLKVQ